MPTPGQETRTSRSRWLIPTLVLLFLTSFFGLVFSGGQCERYDRKMMRMQNMKRHIDSVRSQQQLERLRRSRD